MFDLKKIPVVGMSCALLLLVACGEKEAVSTEPAVRPVRVQALNAGGMSALYEYPGQIRPHLQANLGFEVPGRITELLVKGGDFVTAGQVVATIDPNDYEASLNASLASLKEAESLKERDQKLYDQNAGSLEELERSERGLESAKADVEKAQKAYNDTFLKAPFTGTIAQVLVDDYENVQAKQAVVILHDTTSLEAIVDIPETLWAKGDGKLDLETVTQKTKPFITLTSLPGVSFPAVIKETTTQADPSTRTFEVTLGFEAGEGVPVSPGMTAKVTFSEMGDSTKGIFTVPVRAVGYNENGQAYIWRIDDDNIVHLVNVEAKQMSGELIEIKSSLEAGTRIAVTGIPYLQEGNKVKEWSK